ncbi:MAG: hypothetical protein H0T84_07855 [Tatlockia sp.]|nr:hypothetical protein [Tatlockia sp.]
MSKRKREIIPLLPLGNLNLDTATLITNHLHFGSIVNLLSTSMKNNLFFRPLLDLRIAACMVHAKRKEVRFLVEHNPDLLFKKEQKITDPRGRTFFNVSVYQLMVILRDKKMTELIMPLIPDRLQPLRQEQFEEISFGGADLVRLNFNPLTENDFNRIREFKTQIATSQKLENVMFTLLENPDGLLYYQDDNGVDHFYYANCEKQLIRELTSNLERKTPDYIKFKKILENFELNSSRRSTNDEHKFIEKTFGVLLMRKGIHFEYKGIGYQDNCSGFLLINALRTRYRISEEVLNNGNYLLADAYWKSTIGERQGDVIWLLEALCDPTRPQNKNKPTPPFTIKRNGVDVKVFINGELDKDLGKRYAIFNGGENLRYYNGQPWGLAGCAGIRGNDLLFLNKLVQEAKKTVIEMQQPENLYSSECQSSKI